MPPEIKGSLAVANLVGLLHYTTFMYLKILEAEGKIEFTKQVGKAKFYRIRKS